jgi:hypothetical protein
MGLITTILKACSPLGEPVQKEISDSYYYTKKGDGIMYSQMGNWFELGKKRIEEADVSTFEVLSIYVAKDAHNAYYRGKRLEQKIDIPTFRVKQDNLIMNHYPVDKNNVYHFPINDEAKILPQADPETFVQTELAWGMDKERVYYNDKVTPLNRNSFELLNEQFCKDDSNLYAYSYLFGLTRVQADIAKLQKVDKKLVRDQTHVYAQYPPYMSKNNGNSIHTIPYDNISSLRWLNHDFFELDDQVYFHGFLLEGIKSPNYEIIDYVYILSDSLVYFKDQRIKEADAASFIHVGRDYSKDKNHVYYMHEIQQEADANSFRAVEKRPYFRDDSRYFNEGKEIEKQK